MILKGFIFAVRGLGFVFARLSRPFYLLFIGIGNLLSRFGASLQSSSSRTYAFFSNKNWIW
jgi:hypothetical protein